MVRSHGISFALILGLSFMLPAESAGQSVAGVYDDDGYDLWLPYTAWSIKPGNDRSLGDGELFAPLWQSSGAGLIFTDIRGQIDDTGNYESNWGVGVRHYVNDSWIAGLYGFYDRRETENANTFNQVMFGLEALSVEWEARINGYIPESDGKAVNAMNGAALIAGNIFVSAGQEWALGGVDAEVGKLLYSWGDNADIEVRGFLGAFHFDSDGANVQNISGPRGRVEMRIYDLDCLGRDSRVTVGGELQWDHVRDTQAFAMFRIRIPLYNSPRRRVMSRLERRMVSPIVRDVDVITAAESGPLEQAKIARTGQVVSQALTIDANTVAPEAVVAGAGADSVVIADGTFGTIFTGGTINMNDGQVLMGGTSRIAVIGCNTGAPAIFTGPGTRATIDSGANDVINAADNATVLGLDLMTSGTNAALVLAGDTNVLLQDLGITATGASGIGIESTGSSQFTLNDSTVASTQSAGIESGGTSMFTINRSVFNTVGVGIDANGDSMFTVNNTTITSSNDDGIDADDNTQFTLNNSTVSVMGPGTRGINGTDNSQFTVNDSTITSGEGTGINSAGDSQFTVNRSMITGEDNGVFAGNNSQFTVSGGSVTATMGDAVRADTSAGQTVTFQLSGVTISGAEDGVFIRSVGTGTVNGTIFGNTIGAGVGFDEIHAFTNNNAILNLSAERNVLDGGMGTIRLNESSVNTNDINVTQGAPGSGDGSIEMLNGIPTGNVIIPGQPIDFDQPDPPTP